MSWSYSGNPSSDDRDQLRFIIQDTDSADQLLSDEELDFLLSDEGNPLSAAMRAAEILVAKFSKLCDEKVGQVSVSLSQKRKNYEALLDKLRTRVAIKSAAPFAGGITESQKDVQENNDDRVEPFFTRDLDDFVDSDRDRTGRAITEGIQEIEDND